MCLCLSHSHVYVQKLLLMSTKFSSKKWGEKITLLHFPFFCFYFRNWSNISTTISWMICVPLVLYTYFFKTWLFTSNMNSHIFNLFKQCQEASTKTGKNNCKNNLQWEELSKLDFSLKTMRKYREVIPRKIIVLRMPAAQCWKICE